MTDWGLTYIIHSLAKKTDKFQTQHQVTHTFVCKSPQYSVSPPQKKTIQMREMTWSVQKKA